ncbi:MAG: NAD(P)/FAD-dependent oxidoreductase [Methylocystaceae bacterium]
MELIDAVIVGGGVIGLAVAAELSRRWPQAVIALLEKNQRWGQETSSRNSEVIHAGLYYPDGSLKARLCREGNRLLYDYCSHNRVPHRRVGKLVVALTADEEKDLEALFQHCCSAGVQVEMVPKRRCQEMEPLIPAYLAFYSPDTGIIDSESLMRALYTQSLQQGVAVLLATPALGVDRCRSGYEVRTPREVIKTRLVINCAGLSSDIVANYTAPQKDKPLYQLHYCKGEYYFLRPRLPISHLVYPLPDQHSLGVHLTLDLEGNLRLGPNAYFVDEIDYHMDDRYLETFYRQAAAMLPGLKMDDLYPGYAGIRPKLQGPGDSFCDFIIKDEASQGCPGWINLVGIESPGLTASLAIAREVTALIQPYL